MADTADALHHPPRVDALVRTGLLGTAREAAFDRLVRLAATGVRAPMVTLSFVDDTREFVKAGVGNGAPLALREIPLAASFARYPVAGGRPFVVRDTRAIPELADHPGIDALGAGAYLGVPVFVDGSFAVGALGVFDPEQRAWTDGELAHLLDVVALVETEIELRRTRAASDRHRVVLAAALGCLGDGVVLVDRDGEVLTNPAGAWALTPPDGAAADPSAVTIAHADGTPCGPGELPLDRAILEQASTREELLVRTPREREGRWHEAVAAAVTDGSGQLAGAFCVVRAAPPPPEAPALRERSRTLAPDAVDASTGVFDRRAFETAAHERMAAYRRERRGLLLYLVRIDGLDRIRERLGGNVADRAVQDVVGAVRSAASETDLLGRLSGDALVLVGPDSGHADAARRLGRIQLAVAEKNGEGERPYTLNVRCGVAAWDPVGAVGLDQLLLRADSSARERARAQVSA